MIWIFSVLVAGLVIGALGRLVVPGPNPMGCLTTSLVGIGGSVIGGVIGRLAFGPHLYGHTVSLVLAVLGSALIVWLLQNRRRRVA
ncbi:MAG TPA: hypothetical protein VE990_05310 [Acidimicrobiales bacterium]|nr:hypothetical protein [Acidimicrobiales bacterium]